MRALALIMLLSALLPAEDWFIANETMAITTPTVHEGNIVILDGGVLDIRANFTQTGFIGVFAGGLLKIHGCNFRLQSTYNGQFFLAALETGRIEIDSIRFSSNGWQAGIIALDDGTISIRSSDFFLDPAGTTQPGMYGRGRITLEDSRGAFEVILLDEGRFEARRIPPAGEDPLRTQLWVWSTFGEGDTATLTYPPPGLQDFTFPGPGDTTAFSYLLDDVNIPFWPLLVKPGSQVTLLNNPEDRHLIVGHLLYKDAVLSLRNNSDHADFTLPVVDRAFRVLDSRIWTWNLYPYEDTRLVVKNSVLGEILGSEQSETWVYRSTIDGSGGFLGVSGTASVTLVNSTVTTMVQSVEQGSIAFLRSSLQPHPYGVPSYLTLSGEGRAWLMDTPAPQYLLPNGVHCVPRTTLVPEGDHLDVGFARACPAGVEDAFEEARVLVEDPRTGDRTLLYGVPLQAPRTVRVDLPGWCHASPCVCDAILEFRFGGEERSYRETLCSDAVHGRPAERP
jgi:hypothetical protein